MIVFVSEHCCGRAVKEAMALTSRGYEIALLTSNPVRGRGAFKWKVRYDDPESFFDSLELFSENDIYHVHNEPNWMVSIIREKYPSAKIILDVHDSNYWRTDARCTWYEEEVAYGMADGYVFPSETALKITPIKDLPAVVVPPANPESSFYYGPWNYSGGLVSQGGHTLPGEYDNWRDYTQLYLLIVPHKRVYVYSAEFKQETDVVKHYRKLGVETRSTSHLKMIAALGEHDWCLCGNITGAKVWEVTMPNKFYDAMAAGVPVVNFNCKEAGKIIDEYGVGINVSTVRELLERWDEHIEKRTNVFKYRNLMSMENYIGEVERLYREV
jgi:hypothetical protein